jgi:hypothetical protein
MAMRLDIDFPRPLGRSDKLRVLLAVATLAKGERVRFVRGDYAAVVSGEALGVRRLEEVLAEHGVAYERIRSSLSEEEDQRADDPPGDGQERVRAIGR